MSWTVLYLTTGCGFALGCVFFDVPSVRRYPIQSAVLFLGLVVTWPFELGLFVYHAIRGD